MLWKNDQCGMPGQMRSPLATFGDFEIFRNFRYRHFFGRFSKFSFPYILRSIHHRALISVPIERAKNFQQPGQRNAALIFFPSQI